MTTFTQRLLLSVSLVLIAVGSLSAQYRVGSKYWTIGGTIGASGYEGDLTNLDSPGIPLTQIETIKQPGFNVGFTAAYHFKPRWAIRGSLGYLLLRGSDEKSTNQDNRDRNLSFENGIIEASGVLMFDLLPARRNYRLRRKFNPYVFAGIAAAYSDPRAKIVVTPNSAVTGGGVFAVAGTSTLQTFTAIPARDYGWQKLRPLRTEGQASEYSPIIFSIPFGGGVRYKLTERIDLGLEINFRRSFSDYIDDVSGNIESPIESRPSFFFPLQSQLGGAADANSIVRIAASNRFVGVNVPSAYADRRGSSDAPDWYGSVGLTLSYILDKSPGGVSCPKPGGRRKKGFLGIF